MLQQSLGVDAIYALVSPVRGIWCAPPHRPHGAQEPGPTLRQRTPDGDVLGCLLASRKGSAMSRPKPLLARIGLAAMALLAIPLALLAYTYLFGHVPPDVVAGNPFWPRLLPAHASFGATALLLGFLQFIPRLRNGYPAVHRWTGRTNATCCLLGGTAGLILAFGAPTGAVTTFGFGFPRPSVAGDHGHRLAHGLARPRRRAPSLDDPLLRDDLRLCHLPC